MERDIKITSRRPLRQNDRSYGADYGRAYGDEWSASYSPYDRITPKVNHGYESDQFYTRRTEDLPPPQGREQGGFGGPNRYRRRIKR